MMMMNAERSLPLWWRWILGGGSMTLAIFTNAGTGPMFKYMENNGIAPSLAAAWRCQCMLFFLIPLAIIELWKDGKVAELFQRKPDLPYRVYVHVIFAGLGWCGTLLFWINGLKFISAVRASIFDNLHPLVMVVYLYCSGGILSRYDWIGVGLALVGVLVMSGKQLVEEFGNQKEAQVDLKYQIFGSLLCLLSSCCECGIIINRKRTRKYCPLLQYTAMTTFIVALVASLYSLLMENTSLSLLSSSNSHYIFGWTNSFWSKKILLFGFINGVLCQAGFNFAMQFIDSLLFSSLLLLTIPATGLLAWIGGIEDLPDIFTIIGGCILVAGIGFITYSEHLKNQSGKDHDGNIELKNEMYLGKSDLGDCHERVASISLGSIISGASSSVQYSPLKNHEEEENIS